MRYATVWQRASSKDPRVSAEVDSLARALVEGDNDGALFTQARIIAESQLDLERIQSAKVSLINSHLVSTSLLSTEDAEGGEHKDGLRSDVLGNAIIYIVPQLAKLHRYERRARTRSLQAMRVFWHIKSLIDKAAV
jgi:hypothetical protein